MYWPVNILAAIPFRNEFTKSSSQDDIIKKNFVYFPCYFNKRYRNHMYFTMHNDFVMDKSKFIEEKKQYFDDNKDEGEQRKEDLEKIKKIIEEDQNRNEDEGIYFRGTSGRNHLKKLNDLIKSFNKDKNDLIKSFNKDKTEKIANNCLQTFCGFPYRASWYEAGMAYNIIKKKIKKKEVKENGFQFFYIKKREDRTEEMEVVLISEKSFDKSESIEAEYFYEGSDQIEEVFNKNKKAYEYFRGIAGEIKNYIYIPLYNLFHDKESYSDSCKKDFNKILSNACITVPIFEVYINNIGYGRLHGWHTFYYKDKSAKEQEDWIKENCKDKSAKEQEWIKENIINPEQIRAQLRQAAMSESERISQSDYHYVTKDIYEEKIDRLKGISDFSKGFLDYFFQMIIYIQDWENVWIKNDNNILDWWGRGKAFFLSTNWEDKFKQDISQGEAEKRLKEAEEDKLTLKFNLEEFEDIIEPEGFKDMHYWKDSDQYLNELKDSTMVFEYPDYTYLPSRGEEREEYEQIIKKRIFALLYLAISTWKQDRYALEIKKQQVMIEQMSHNLVHPLQSIAGSIQSNNCETSTFLSYLRDRIGYFSQDFRQRNNSKEITEFTCIDKLSKQQLLFNHILGSDKGSLKLKFLIHNGGRKGRKMNEQQFYMIFENYIRNVGKHSGLSGADFSCYVSALGAIGGISLWEDAIKCLNKTEDINVLIVKDIKDLNETEVFAENLNNKTKADFLQCIKDESLTLRKLFAKLGPLAKNDFFERLECCTKRDLTLNRFFRNFSQVKEAHKNIHNQALDDKSSRGICAIEALLDDGGYRLKIVPVMTVVSNCDSLTLKKYRILSWNDDDRMGINESEFSELCHLLSCQEITEKQEEQWKEKYKSLFEIESRTLISLKDFIDLKYIKNILVGDPNPNVHNDKPNGKLPDNAIDRIENALAIPVVSSNNKIKFYDATSLEEISINNRFSIEYNFRKR